MKKIEKILAFIVWTLVSFGQQPTSFPTPFELTPSPDYSTMYPLRFITLDQNYVGFQGPDTVYQIVVNSATAANPMVLTLESPVPPNIVAGGNVTITGAAGSGCSGMNATHSVTATGSNTVTIAFDGTGCTYTAMSGTVLTAIRWVLPDRDGTSGDCLGWTAAYTIGWVTCSGGGSPPFSDATPLLYSIGDPTKLLQFDLSGITTATTRVWTPQDADYVVAGINIPQSFTADQTLNNSDLLVSGTVNIGTRADHVNTIEAYEVYQQYSRIYSPTPIIGPTYTMGVNTLTEYLYLADTISTKFEWNTGGAAAWGTFGWTNTSSCTLGGACYYVRFQAPALSSTTTYTLPATYPASSGSVLSSTTGGTLSWASPGGAPFTDANPIMFNDPDPSKLLAFALGGFTTATTRTLTPQNASYIIAGTNIAQTFSANQTISGANVLISGTVDFGTRADHIDDLEAYDVHSQYLNIYSPTPVTGSNWNLAVNTSTEYLYMSDAIGTRFEVNTGGLAAWGTLGITSTTNCTIGGTCYYVRFQTPTLSSTTTYTLPATYPAGNGYALVSTTGGTLSWAAAAGTVTSVDQTFTGGLISVSGAPITSSGTLALTVAGTQGGMPYFSSNSSWASTAAGTTGQIMFSNGTSPPAFGTLNTIYSTILPNVNGTYNFGSSSFRLSSIYSNNFIANSSIQDLGLTASRCLRSDSSSFISNYSGECVLTSTTISTTSPLGGGGDLSTNRTLTCTTCVTTAGGQSISGTTTLSTLSVSTITGTITMSGGMTVTGNFYNRSFSGSGVSCSGVADGWTGWDTSGQNLIICAGGNRYKVTLASY